LRGKFSERVFYAGRQALDAVVLAGSSASLFRERQRLNSHMPPT
jgi:hypothetical protein